MPIKTRLRYTMLGSDYSQQEPRLLASYSEDETMIDAYKNKKDLYAVIASKVYNNNYEDNLEFDANGNLYIEGKKRRSSVKSLLLGMMYGMGSQSIAEEIKPKEHDVATKEDIKNAEQLMDSFFSSYPKVKKWMTTTETDAIKNGYVEDILGRKRRLPDLQLPEVEIIQKKGKSLAFNPFLYVEHIEKESPLQVKYKKLYESCRGYKERERVKADAIKEGIIIKDNSGKISQAKRQCVNARIQGGAASMIKLAMIKAREDDLLNTLGFRMLIPVHDEIVGECPAKYSKEVGDRLASIMVDVAKPICKTPMKCDADSFSAWYVDVFAKDLKENFDKLVNEKNFTKQEALDKLKAEHIELSDEQFVEITKEF